MMVGSDCSFIFCFSRLTNTAATRVRSSGLPVSFSMIEARMTSCSGVFSGSSGLRCSQTSLRSRCCAACMRWITCSRGPRQQAAFTRNSADIAAEHVAIQQKLHGLLGGEAFRHRDRVLDDLALHHRLQHVAHAGMLGEEVFAELQLGAGLEGENAADENCVALVDH